MLRMRDLVWMAVCVVAVIIVFYLSGCATTQKSEFGKHPTIWASGDHFWYSMRGYKNPTVKDYFYSQNERWWGEPVELKRPFKVE